MTDEYIEQNTGSDGRVQFYEGYYSKEGQPGGVGWDEKTIGNAFVTYTPAEDNPFYYVDEDTLLYTDAACTQPATEYSEDASYYFKDTYYQQVTTPGSDIAATVETAIVSRPAGTIRQESTEVQDGKLYLKAHEPRLGVLADFRRDKEDENNTETAELYLYLLHTGQDDNNHHTFQIFHGNNGRLSVPLPPGTLSVTKNVVNGENVEPDAFTFEITLIGADTLQR